MYVANYILTAVGGNRAFIPGRVNYHFKFSGPSYTIDTACSSSLAALYLACNALWRGEVDTAIVGGTNVLTNPDMTAGLDRGHFLSRTGNCKTFGKSKTGDTDIHATKHMARSSTFANNAQMMMQMGTAAARPLLRLFSSVY